VEDVIRVECTVKRGMANLIEEVKFLLPVEEEEERKL
jgi:hypothetical protein